MTGNFQEFLVGKLVGCCLEVGSANEQRRRDEASCNVWIQEWPAVFWIDGEAEADRRQMRKKQE